MGFKIKNLILFSILVSVSLFSQLSSDTQWMSPEIQQQYEKYLKEQQAPMLSQQVPSYETPPIYDGTDTLRFEQKEIREEVVAEKIPEDFFFDRIIVDGDTVQSIRKATPKDLKLFGSVFFDNLKTATITASPVSNDYILGIGDNIIVSLWGNVDFEYNLTVDREGKIFIPRSGTISVAGLNMDSARNVIIKALDKIYSDFELDITLSKMSGSTVFVVGEARSPGTYSLPGMAHVIEALMISGGPNEFGSYRNIKVYRSGRLISVFDMYDFFIEGKSKGGIQLANGDIVLIPRLGPIVKVRGQVSHPAIYEIEDSTSLGEVLELAGGPLPTANISSAMVDRIKGSNYGIVTVDFSDSVWCSKPALDGDDISVFSIEVYRYDIVTVQGQVVQPGAYGYFDSMRVSDLLEEGHQLLPDAYRNRADLVRILPDRSKSIIPLNLRRIIDDPNCQDNIYLQNEDLVVVYSIWDVTDREFVSIYGAVRRPGEFELYKNMHISDIIFESGGFTPSAFIEKAELARVRPGEPTKVTDINLVKALENPKGPEDILLRPYDVVFIRDVPGWKLQDIVTIVGEVEFPGKYALRSQNERLSDLIYRTGSFTDEAFISGAVFIRPRLADEIENRNLRSIVQQTQEAVLDSEGNIVTSPFLFIYTPEQIARIILDMDRVVAGRLDEDILLEDGDSIYIPKTPTGVNVIGMVASNGTIRWVHGKRLNYYIDRAGGITRNADVSGIRVVKANGKVIKASLRTGNIEPGDAIIVPQRIKKKTDWISTLGETVSIISSLATTIYILLKL
ncbi:SLBB domain-containing protein [bacterium]|nr:SLBB domain-containing protein [bacterium]